MIRLVTFLILAWNLQPQARFVPLKTEVHFGDKGPYPFLVDTGTQMTMVDPQLAKELGLEPRFRIELVSIGGKQMVPGALADSLHLAAHFLPKLEVLIHDLKELRRRKIAVRGVLGSDALTQFSFSLDPAAGRIDLDAARPSGEPLPFSVHQGQIVLTTRIGEQSFHLMLDSGANGLVLFRPLQSSSRKIVATGAVDSFGGSKDIELARLREDVVFGNGQRLSKPKVALLDRPERDIDGLLPIHLFQKVHVDWPHKELVLVP